MTLYEKFKLGVVVLCVAASIVAAVLLTGCKSFKPVQIEGNEPECNDFYTVMKYNVKNDNKDGAFPAIVYGECQKARLAKRKQARENHCRDMVYGKDKLLDKSDYKKYAAYLECTK